MIEGGSSKDFRRAKTFLYDEPEAAKVLLDTLAESVKDYLNAQILAGAQAVQIFDSWGGALSHSAYIDYSLNPMRKIISGLIREHEGRRVPVILFTKGGGQWLEPMSESGADCLGLDWTTSIKQARARVGDSVALQGNMDPAILNTKPEIIRSEVARILAEFGHGDGHVFNLGHGITPDVPPANVEVFFNAVTELSTGFHR
jgi:uroporphyrinogen decarboxylase